MTSPAALPRATIAERTFPCGALRLNAAVGPRNGPPLVLLHGVTRSWRDWRPVLPALLPRWQVYAVEHRGHGESDRAADGAYRVADYAASAEGFLREHVGAGAVLWGHSLGAMAAAMLAARAQGLVRALVLEDPPGTLLAGGLAQSRHLRQFIGIRALLRESLDTATLAARLATLPVEHPRDGRLVELRALRDADALRFSAECLVRMDPAVLDVLLAGRWLDGLDWFGALPHIACPTLLLRADVECGGMLSLAEAARITDAIPQARRIEHPGLGHHLHTADPSGTLSRVHAFLTPIAPP